MGQSFISESYSRMLKMTGQPGDAEDLTMEAFNKAFSKVFHTLLSRVFIRTSNMELLCDVGVPGLVFNRMIF